jgi:hypothetical protein
LYHSYANQPIPERGFLVENCVLTKERGVTGRRWIIGLQIMKKAISAFSSVSNIPITENSHVHCQQAHFEYLVCLEKEKQGFGWGGWRGKVKKEKTTSWRKCNQLNNRLQGFDLIEEAMKKLTDAMLGSGTNLHAAKVVHMCWKWEMKVTCHIYGVWSWSPGEERKIGNCMAMLRKLDKS